MFCLQGAGVLSAAEKGQLLAPVYPGAKMIYNTQGEDCVRMASQCKYGTRDSLKKVLDFYGGKFGAAQVYDHSKTQGHPEAFVPLQTYYSNGEGGSGWWFTGVGVEGLNAPVWPDTDAKAEALLGTLEKFSGFNRSVNWTRGKGLGFEGLHSIEQMKALFTKYAYLEARYYPAGPDGRRIDQVLRNKYEQLAEQREQRARDQSEAQQERAVQGMQQNMNAKIAESQRAMAQGGSAQVKQENAEMDALLKRKPKLRAKLNPLSRKMMEQMQAGQMDEAEATSNQMDKLMRSDPEVAALMDKQERRTREQGAMEAAKVQQFMSSMTDMQHASVKAVADALWNTWSEYLAELAKLESYTYLITIHTTDDASSVIRDHAAVLKKYREELAKSGGKASPDGRFFEKEQTASAPASSPQPAAGKQVAGGNPPAPKPEEKKDPVGDAARKGMNLLKKLF